MATEQSLYSGDREYMDLSWDCFIKNIFNTIHIVQYILPYYPEVTYLHCSFIVIEFLLQKCIKCANTDSLISKMLQKFNTQ